MKSLLLALILVADFANFADYRTAQTNIIIVYIILDGIFLNNVLIILSVIIV